MNVPPIVVGQLRPVGAGVGPEGRYVGQRWGPDPAPRVDVADLAWIPDRLAAGLPEGSWVAARPGGRLQLGLGSAQTPAQVLAQTAAHDRGATVPGPRRGDSASRLSQCLADSKCARGAGLTVTTGKQGPRMECARGALRAPGPARSRPVSGAHLTSPDASCPLNPGEPPVSHSWSQALGSGQRGLAAP